ncbi:MAG: hypothetical protein EXR93_10590 [Gemmatimonadetes bacterium]|nr:hypothetical protein [Gemmatimonadota bacterium]
MTDRRAAWRAFQVVLGVLVVGLAVRVLAGNWAAFRAQDVTWRLSPGWIALSLIIVFAMYAVLIEAWRRVVVGLNQQLGFLEAARIWALASLGKYIPGKVWAVAGAAALAKEAGVDPQAAVTAALVLQALALGSGVVVTAVTAPEALGQGGGGVWVALALTAVALAVLAGTASPLVIAAITRRFAPDAPLPAVPRGLMVQAFIANCVAWVGYGLAFVCLARGTFPDASLTLAQAIGVFASSYLVGLIALFAPGGLGARESVLLLLLAPTVGPKLAVALAVASRLQLTVTELGVAVPFLFGIRGSPGRTRAG